ncbi:MAG: NFACT family protein [Candidatus Aenigmatarchaeota archaeon]
MREISSLELMFLIKRLNLKNLKIQKIKQIPFGFLFELYPSKKNLIITQKYFFVSEKNYDSISPSNFCEFIKSKLVGERILEVKQKDFDRIVEIRTQNYFLILEFFGNGNIILTDNEKTIINALEMREWRDRKIKKGEKYVYPPSAKNPFTVSLKELNEIMDEKEIIRILAKDLSFGGETARKICEKLKISPESKSSLNTQLVYDFLKNIEKNFSELENINEELEKDYETENHLYKSKDLTEIVEKGKRIRQQQLKALEELNKKIEQMNRDIKIIMENYIDFQQKFDEIKNTPKKEIEINGIKFNPRKSFNENIQDFYKKIKEMKKKIEGINNILDKFEIKVKEKVEKKEKVEWYEKFRWFISSDNFLVIGGKDAESNETIIRKHLKEGDLVFHTDITGSPFVIIKNPDKKKIPETTIREAAEFCACYSKAWKIGIQADVYYILPEQVKKEGGLPKGSFMIYGKREWIRRIDLLLAIGVYNGKIIYGPISSVKVKTKKYIVITVGEENINEQFNKYFGELAEQAKKVIPYGKCKIVEIHGN